MHRSPARRLLGAVCGLIAVACIAMVVPAAVAEPGWNSGPPASVISDTSRVTGLAAP